MMMHRLQQIQEGITSSRKNIENNIKGNKQSEEKMDKMIFQMEEIIRKENIPEYKGDRDMLTK